MNQKEPYAHSSDVKNYIKNLSKTRKALWIGLPLLASALIITVLILFFQFHGMTAMYQWVDIVQVIVIFVGIFAGFLIGLPFIDAYIAKNPQRMQWIKEKTSGIRFPSRAFWAITTIALLIPISLFSWVQVSGVQKGNKMPQLLISDQTGEHGIPDLGVVFWTENEILTSITWGYGSNEYVIEESQKKNSHTFMLTDLPPNTECWYRINHDFYNDTLYNFTTSSNVDETLKIAISSDCHISGERSHEDSTINTLDSITGEENNFDYFFELGDIVDYGFSDKNWRDAIELLSPYTSQMPTRTLIGNHDAMINGADFYKDYYYPDDMPLDTESGSTPLYQRIDINGIHFLLLDLEWGTAETYFGAQETWLKSQLNKINPNDWTIVMSHSFYYAKGSYSEGTPWFDNPETIEHLVPLFEQNDVDMVFSGHIHDMQHLVKNNVSYSIVGGMGGYHDPDPNQESEATSLYFDNENFGYVDLEINGDKADLIYRNETSETLYSSTLYR